MTEFHASSRRRFIQGVSGLTVGLGMAGTANAREYDPTVIFNDQSSRGREVTVAEIVTNEPVYWRVHAGEAEYARGHFDGKQRIEDETIELETEIESSKRIYFSMFPDGGGQSVAHDDAFVTVENDSIVGVNEIEKDPDAGFHFPYYLYVPPTEGTWNANKPLLVHQNNSPSTSDDISYHKEHARSKLESPSRQISDELGIPLLVPVTPRPHENRDANRLQAMGNRALRVDDERLERIDLQVISMIEHAQDILANNSHPVRDEVILNGYSGSGKFAQRFTMLHPEKVVSVTAGGMSGVPTLPLEEAKGHTLNYYLGIADFVEFLDKPADVEAVEDVNLLYYEGGEDANDFLLPDDPHRPEMRDTALEVFGEDIVDDRVPFTRQAFEEAGISLEYRIYEENGHEWAPVDDLIAFHEPVVPANERDVSTTTPSIESPTTTANDASAATAKEETTASEAPGLGVISGLVGLIGGSVLGSRLVTSSED